jgi:hypothetical protein
MSRSIIIARVRFDNEPLTADHDTSQRCSNPFCHVPITAKQGNKFCSDRCRMDGYVLRRAKIMIDEVGIVASTRFHRILNMALDDCIWRALIAPLITENQAVSKR